MTAHHKPFTMLELVVVMMLLVIAFAIVTPRLAGFFGGRQLDDSAKRLWALTRYGRQEAIQRGVPMGLWWDAESRELELAAWPGYPYAPEPRHYPLASELMLQAEVASADEPVISWWSDGTVITSSATKVALYDRRHPLDSWVLTQENALGLYTLNREMTP